MKYRFDERKNVWKMLNQERQESDKRTENSYLPSILSLLDSIKHRLLIIMAALCFACGLLLSLYFKLG